MKDIIVKWDLEAHRAYEELRIYVKQGKNTSKKPSYKQLLSSIDEAIKNLKTNPFYGDLIPRKYLTKKVIDRYGTNKIFRIELVGYWRLLYTAIGDEAQIIALILEYMNHKTYDKLFGYRKK